MNEMRHASEAFVTESLVCVCTPETRLVDV